MPGKTNSFVNLLVQSEGDVVAFDVDCAFTKTEPGYDLVEIGRQNGLVMSKELEEIIKKNEARRIHHKITVESSKVYEKFVSLMDHIQSLREQFGKIGFKNARDYFSDREKWLRAMAK